MNIFPLEEPTPILSKELSNYISPPFPRGKNLTAMPRGSSSSTQLLLDDDYGVGSGGSGTFDSRQSLCEDSLVPGSPRHLMTYVNSSRETIPLEIAQDIPDVML